MSKRNDARTGRLVAHLDATQLARLAVETARNELAGVANGQDYEFDDAVSRRIGRRATELAREDPRAYERYRTTIEAVGALQCTAPTRALLAQALVLTGHMAKDGALAWELTATLTDTHMSTLATALDGVTALTSDDLSEAEATLGVSADNIVRTLKVAIASLTESRSEALRRRDTSAEVAEAAATQARDIVEQIAAEDADVRADIGRDVDPIPKPWRTMLDAVSRGDLASFDVLGNADSGAEDG